MVSQSVAARCHIADDVNVWRATVVGRRRTLLQATNLSSVDTQFNNHNSYAAVDFNVTYLVCH